MIIIDYGVGNIGSIINMFKRIGVRAVLSSDKDEILAAEKLFLPGVGSFDHGMACLQDSGLIEVLEEKVIEKKTPVMGVCLGMQLLFEESEEGQRKGLGWIKGRVRRFSFDNNSDHLKIPHMGWNVVYPNKKYPITNGFPEEPRFYFAHSYHAECANADNIVATTHYGYDFPSIVSAGHIYGAQFHPEKSHKFGMQILKNFAEIA